MVKKQLFTLEQVKLENYEDYKNAITKYYELITEEEGISKEINQVQDEYENVIEEKTCTEWEVDKENPRLVELLEIEEKKKNQYNALVKRLKAINATIRAYSNKLGGAKYYDKKQLCDNIRYFIKEKNVKLGEIERNSGNTVGYMSRIEKEDNISAPNFDFIITASSMLNVTIEELLYSKPLEATETEKYILSFLKKLAKDTIDDKLEWKEEKVDYLNTIGIYNNEACHPMFSIKHIEIGEDMNGYPNYEEVIYFDSESFGEDTSILGSCYNIRLKNGVFVYLMDVSTEDEPLDPVIEVWLHSSEENKFLCKSNTDTFLSDIVEILYSAVYENLKHPKISKIMKNSMDAFMNDDLEDDDDGTLPFNF